MYKLQDKPIPPPSRLIYESDGEPKDLCKKCGSSLYRKFGIFKTSKCVQKECDNHFKDL
jgi:hypothetical protein